MPAGTIALHFQTVVLRGVKGCPHLTKDAVFIRSFVIDSECNLAHWTAAGSIATDLVRCLCCHPDDYQAVSPEYLRLLLLYPLPEAQAMLSTSYICPHHAHCQALVGRFIMHILK